MFLFVSQIGLAGALTLAAGGPPLLAPSPVSVVSCQYEKLPGIGNDLGAGMPARDIGNLRITFENQAPVAATDVRFAVQYAHRSQVIDAAGTFSSGTPITQDFGPSTNPGYNGPATCTVQSVTFSDGSTWQAL
jgi:hypothetical protein